MTQNDWLVAVTREIRADLWYEHPEQDEALVVTQQSPDTGVLMASRNGNSPKASVAAV
jgi:hypothetical protein